jgi:hypothetical protein
MKLTVQKIKRSAGKWVAAALGAAFLLTMMTAFLYLSFRFQMAGYDDYVACNPNSGIGRIEWFIGVRPVEDSCRPLRPGGAALFLWQ